MKRKGKKEEEGFVYPRLLSVFVIASQPLLYTCCECPRDLFFKKIAKTNIKQTFYLPQSRISIWPLTYFCRKPLLVQTSGTLRTDAHSDCISFCLNPPAAKKKRPPPPRWWTSRKKNVCLTRSLQKSSTESSNFSIPAHI
jgi:hypothetical protein